MECLNFRGFTFHLLSFGSGLSSGSLIYFLNEFIGVHPHLAIRPRRRDTLGEKSVTVIYSIPYSTSTRPHAVLSLSGS